MQCIRNGAVYSWQGQAALGGFIGDDFDSFFSSVCRRPTPLTTPAPAYMTASPQVVSGAAGTYMATLGDNSTVHTDLTMQPGQARPPSLSSCRVCLPHVACVSFFHNACC